MEFIFICKFAILHISSASVMILFYFNVVFLIWPSNITEGDEGIKVHCQNVPKKDYPDAALLACKFESFARSFLL